MKLSTAAFDMGMMLACVQMGEPIKSAAEMGCRLTDSQEVDRWLLRIGETAYREDGRMGSLGYQLCKRASSAPTLSPQLRELAAIVGCAIGGAVYQLKQAAEEADTSLSQEQVKSATALWLRNLLSGASGAAPELGKVLLGGAVATGAVGGGLTWAANRNIKSDEEDIEAMKAKIQTYRRITKDIDDELARRTAAV